MCYCCRYQWASPGLGRLPCCPCTSDGATKTQEQENLHGSRERSPMGPPMEAEESWLSRAALLAVWPEVALLWGVLCAAGCWPPPAGFQEHPHPENVSRVGQLIPGWGDTLHYIVFVQAPVTKFHRIRESAPTLSVFQVLQNRRPSGALSSLWQKCLSGRTTASNKDFCLGRRLRSVLSSSFGVLHIFQMSYKEKLHRV